MPVPSGSSSLPSHGREAAAATGAGRGAPTSLTSRTAGLGPAAKAEILVEALPYIRRFWGKVVVVKYGGNALAAGDPAGTAGALADFATDVVLMRSVGMRPVVVHGGGPQIGDLMARLGKAPEFRNGLRVTDAETLEIARMVLVGKINRDIVSAVNVHGPLAVGVSGEDAGLLQASRRDDALGFVGDIARVAPELLLRLLAENLVPVVATIGSDETGQAYNINADTAAGAIAAALQAEKLVFLSDVEGIRADPRDPASLVSQLSTAELRDLLTEGAVVGGMVPKVEAALSAVSSGVAQAHILDGRVPHVLLLEFFTRSGIGTMVLP
ncbi:MAG TPA: acetylglutamate kinase [Acidimicrobiales bacterium]|nr:acetylglutamate kinase [Acidimicrobiales bacterium]